METPHLWLGASKSPTLCTLCSFGLCISSHLPWGEAFLNIGSFVIVMEKSATWSLIFWRTDESRSKTVKRRLVQKNHSANCVQVSDRDTVSKQALNHCVRYSQGRVCNPKTQVSNLLYLRKGNTQLVSASQQDIVVPFLLQAKLLTSPIRRDNLWKCGSYQVSFLQLTCHFRRQRIRSLTKAVLGTIWCGSVIYQSIDFIG